MADILKIGMDNYRNAGVKIAGFSSMLRCSKGVVLL